ncbi:AMP-binding protein, partial [Streptomyces tricolor]
MDRHHAVSETGFRSYAEELLRALSAEPSRPAVTTAEGRVISAAEFRDQVHRLGAELADRGVDRGTTVTLLTGNTAEALAARYAANLAGARVVSLYDGMSPPVMARVMESVDCSLLLVDDQRHATARELLTLPGTPRALALGPGDFAEDVLTPAARRPGPPMGGRVGAVVHRWLPDTRGPPRDPHGHRK